MVKQKPTPPTEAIECASPPCMLHESEPAFQDWTAEPAKHAPAADKSCGKDRDEARKP